MSIKLTAPILVGGVNQPVGTILALGADQEAELVNRGVAVYVVQNIASGGELVEAMFDRVNKRLVLDGIAYAALPLDVNGNPISRYTYSLSKSGIPMVLPSSGSIGNNGALSGLTALPATLENCYMYFPAGAIYAASVAGFYYVVMSSTTAGTIYADTWTGGVPVIPATPTPIVATGPGAYIQTTGADITAASFTVPGGALGPNGSLNIYPNFGANNTAGSKSWTAKYANNTLVGKVNTTSTMDNTPAVMYNAGRVDRQICTNYVGFNANAGATFQRISVDSTVDQTLTLTLKIAVATDFMFLQGFDAVLSF